MAILKRRVFKAEIEGYGDVYLRCPSVGMALKLAEQGVGTNGLASLMDLVQQCLCDEAGNPLLIDSAAAQELDTISLQRISKLILGMISGTAPGDAEKNSQGGRSESSPTN